MLNALKQGQTVTHLVHNDQIHVEVTYPDTSKDVYIWNLIIPEPKLTDATYNPGTPSTNFNDAVFNYDLDLDTGATFTTTRVSKTPGVLDTTIVHKSRAAGDGTVADVIICENCDYDRVGFV